MALSLVLMGVPAVGGCAFGEACSDAGCYSGVELLVNLPEDEPREGMARVVYCLDGECDVVSGRVARAEGFSDRETELSVGREGPRLRISKEYYGTEYSEPDFDFEDAHELSVTVQIGQGRRIGVERSIEFEEVKPNGPDCEPTCWFARLRT